MSEWQPVGAEELLNSIEAAVEGEQLRDQYERRAEAMTTIALGRHDPELSPSFLELQKSLAAGAKTPSKDVSHEAMDRGRRHFSLVRDWDPSEVAAGRGSYVPQLPPTEFPEIPDAPPPPKMSDE